ncbi:MAG: 4Fe-4S binding protein [Bacteroidales bacterium]|nr:4Fe-4S binding protein [Bacteroidales bacterium]MCF8457280.1 4Fe-4S binding protein [Bacteroidales bacterium]
MRSIINYLKEIFGAVAALFKGMRVTGYYFFHPKEIVTQQYPENRATLTMFDRFKGEVIMPHNENNEHKCTACGICEMNCPNGSIEIISEMKVNEEGKKKKVLSKHIYHLGMCTFCNLCVKTCPSNALAMGQDFEHAVFDRSKLNKVLNKPGSVLMKGTE